MSALFLYSKPLGYGGYRSVPRDNEVANERHIPMYYEADLEERAEKKLRKKVKKVFLFLEEHKDIVEQLKAEGKL
jgi:hypothetical protein